MKELTTTIRKKVSEWNNTCSLINSSLFLADSFEPKPIPEGANDEVVFWYNVTNLYALFADCMPYFTKPGVYFNYTQIKLNNTKCLLAQMQDNCFLTNNESQEIEKFVKAIKEARSCFCHNKHKSTLKTYLLNNGFGFHSQSWKFFSHLGCSGYFNYEEALNLLFVKTKAVITIIDKAINSFITYKTNTLVEEWSKSIAAWYLSSHDIIYRGLLLYKKIGRIPYVEYGFEKMNNQKLEKLARKNGSTTEEFVQELHNELTDAIIYNSATATPENVLYILFDRLI